MVGWQAQPMTKDSVRPPRFSFPFYSMRCHILLSLPLILLTSMTLQAGTQTQAELLAAMPREIIDTLAGSGRPDKNGLVGTNRREGWIHAALQRGAMLMLSVGAARGDKAVAEDAWRAIDAVFSRQKPEGNFESGSFQGRTQSRGDDLSGTSFWLSELCEALLVVRESPLADQFKERIDALLPKIRSAAHWLAAGEAELARGDSKAPNRLFFDAKAFGFAALLTDDDSLMPAGERFFEAGLKMQREDGAFDERGGGDTSYQAVNLLKLQVLALRFPQKRLSEVVSRGMKWELARILPTGEVSTAENTRVRPGGESFLGHEKAVNYGEVVLALLYYSASTGDKQAADAAARSFKFGRELARKK